MAHHSIYYAFLADFYPNTVTWTISFRNIKENDTFKRGNDHMNLDPNCFKDTYKVKVIIK